VEGHNSLHLLPAGSVFKQHVRNHLLLHGLDTPNARSRPLALTSLVVARNLNRRLVS
jgi:hypothetical protein